MITLKRKACNYICGSTLIRHRPFDERHKESYEEQGNVEKSHQSKRSSELDLVYKCQMTKVRPTIPGFLARLQARTNFV